MVNKSGLKLAFQSCIFAMLNAVFEMRFSGCFLLEPRAAPGMLTGWRPSAVYRTCPGASQPQPTGEQGRLVLGFGLKAAVCLVSQSCPTVMFRGLLLEQLSGPRTCVLLAEQLTLGVTHVCHPLDRVGVFEHHQGSWCRPVLTMARKRYACVPRLFCASKSLMLQGDVGAEILVWDCSGKWLRKEIQLPELLHRGMWAHLWEVMWWWLHPSSGSCTCQGRCGRG